MVFCMCRRIEIVHVPLPPPLMLDYDGWSSKMFMAYFLLVKGENGGRQLLVKNIDVLYHWLCNNIQAEGHNKYDYLAGKPVFFLSSSKTTKTLGRLMAQFIFLKKKEKSIGNSSPPIILPAKKIKHLHKICLDTVKKELILYANVDKTWHLVE